MNHTVYGPLGGRTTSTFSRDYEKHTGSTTESVQSDPVWDRDYDEYRTDLKLHTNNKTTTGQLHEFEAWYHGPNDYNDGTHTTTDLFEGQPAPTPPPAAPSTNNKQPHSFGSLVFDLAEDAVSSLVNKTLNENPALRALGLLGLAAIADVTEEPKAQEAEWWNDSGGDWFSLGAYPGFRGIINYLTGYSNAMDRSAELDASRELLDPNRKFKLGDAQRRSGAAASEALQQSRSQIKQFARDTAADLAVEASTSGLGHFLAILDDVNDARKANAFAKARKVPVDKVVASIQNSGKFDTVVKTASEARALLKKAFPDALELPPAVSGKPYPKPPAGVKKWFQLHPPEKGVGFDLSLPHFKYEDWTRGKKGSGGSLGHIFFLDPHN